MRSKSIKIIEIVGIVCFLIFTLFPYYWMLLTVIKPKAELFELPVTFIASSVNLKNFITPWRIFPIATYFANSIVITAISVLITTMLSSMAAYGLHNQKFRKYAKYIVVFLLITQLLPGTVTVVPFYFIMQKIGLVNTRVGLILPYIAWALPFSILMLNAYISSGYPQELEESAKLDGCTNLQIYRKIAFPLIAPGLVAAGANTFMMSWKEFMWASIMLTSGSKKPLSIGLRDMVGEGGAVDYIQEFMAVAILATIPAFIIFFITQKQISGGLTAGAVKN